MAITYAPGAEPFGSGTIGQGGLGADPRWTPQKQAAWDERQRERDAKAAERERALSEGRAYWEGIASGANRPGMLYDPLKTEAKARLAYADEYRGSDQEGNAFRSDFSAFDPAIGRDIAMGRAMTGQVPISWSNIDKKGRLDPQSYFGRGVTANFYNTISDPRNYQLNQGWVPGSVASQGYADSAQGQSRAADLQRLFQGRMGQAGNVRDQMMNTGAWLGMEGRANADALQQSALGNQASANRAGQAMTQYGRGAANAGQSAIDAQMRGYYGTQDARAAAQARASQMAGAQRFNDIASGRAQTVAELQTPLMQEQARRQALSLLATGGMGNNPAALRNAIMSGEDAATRIAAQAIPQIAQERQAAAQAYSDAMGGVRGQDISALSQYLGAQQAANQARLGYAGLGQDYAQTGLGYAGIGQGYGTQAQGAASLGLQAGQLQNQFAGTGLGFENAAQGWGGQMTDAGKLGLGYAGLGQNYATMQQQANVAQLGANQDLDAARRQDAMNKLAMLYGQPTAPLTGGQKALQAAGNVLNAAAGPFALFSGLF